MGQNEHMTKFSVYYGSICHSTLVILFLVACFLHSAPKPHTAMIFLAASKAKAALGKTFWEADEDVRVISIFLA